ncbi:uncharacterized protein LOC132800012 [Ziziphus jujuba]|uniref:Uncharacterized protein LOC132800012 n=1 Tax=Ziziphus jujuba TaxID=326968 RepID=A0ABM3ZWM0_ZIZJJ|nr:uncharacterized protein LOC132800012 [Ziziphus jujuba]
MVSSLKLPNGEWDVHRVESMFDQALAKCIKQIFWTTNEQPDKLIWTGTKSGMYSVKSAYRMDEEIEERDERWWNFLWKSFIHERSKFFLWKLANGGLPLRSNLIARGLNIENSQCVHGCRSDEMELHVFFHCEIAKIVCPYGRQGGFVCLQCHYHGTSVVASKSSASRRTCRRNCSAPDTVRKCSQELKEVLRRDRMDRHHLGNANFRINSEWSRPPPGAVKLNSDTAVRRQGSFLVVIARNDRGKILHMQTFKSIVNDPEIVELEAILKAL